MKPENNYIEYDVAKQISESLINSVIGDDIVDAKAEKWLSEDKTAIELVEKLSDENKIKEICTEFNDIEKRRVRNIRRLTVDALKRKTGRRQMIIVRYVIASCAAAIAVLSFLVFNENEKQDENNLASDRQIIERPILILSNGKSIDLKVDNKDILDSQMIVNNRNGKLNYKTSTDNKKNEEESFHRLVVPRMQTFSVILSDGTLVTLNANSEIHYPAIFKGKQRKIDLKGEAYFKVTKNAKPFIVHVEGVDIKVYGTEFNVNTHTINQIRTTLISGSVGVTVNSSPEVIMKPKQSSVVNLSENSCVVSDVSVSQYVSWMNGDFIYENANVTSMLNDVAAWYGVEIYYDASLFKDVVVSAAFNRAESLNKILKSIGDIVNVKFVKIDNNRYVIE